MPIRKISEDILKDNIKKLRSDKSDLVKSISEITVDISNMQSRKTNIQSKIEEVNNAIDAIKQDLTDAGIPT